MSTFWIVLTIIVLIVLVLGIVVFVWPCLYNKNKNKKQKGKHYPQENEGVLLDNLVENQFKIDTDNSQKEAKNDDVAQEKQNLKYFQVSKGQKQQQQIIPNQEQIQNTNKYQNNQINYRENQNQALNNYQQPNRQEFIQYPDNNDYYISLQMLQFPHDGSEIKKQQENIDNLLKQQQFNQNEITETQVSNQTQNNQNQFDQQVVININEQLQVNKQPDNNINQWKQQASSNQTIETQVQNQTYIQFNLQENQYQYQVKKQSNNNGNQLQQQEYLVQHKAMYTQQLVLQFDEQLDNIDNQLKQKENFSLNTEAQVSNQIQKSQNETNQQEDQAEQFKVQIDEQFYNNDKKFKQVENFIQIKEAQILNQTQKSKNQVNQQEVQSNQYLIQIEQQFHNNDFNIEYQKLCNLILEQKIVLQQIDESLQSTENQINMKNRENDFSKKQLVEKFSQINYLVILNNQLMKLKQSYQSFEVEIENANKHIKQLEHNQQLQSEIESIQNYKQTLLESVQINKENQQLIEKVKELISIVEQFESDESYDKVDDEDFLFNPDPDVKSFINDLYDKTCRQRAVEIQYRPFVRQVEDFNSLKKNYNISLRAGKELRENYCNQIKFVRGDGNCFYTAFGFQFLKYLLIKYKDKEFDEFLTECEQMKMPMKLYLSENSPEITNQELENKMLIEFFNRLRRLRKIENLKERLNQLEKEFAAYEQSEDQIEQDGCLYALATIFLRNYSNYAVDFHEMKAALFDRQNLLIWEKECNSTEIVIDALSRKLNLHSILILFENKEFEVLEYQKQAENKIILLIKPGHYNIGIDSAQEENILIRIIDQILLKLNQIKTQIQELFQLIQKSEDFLKMPLLQRQLS